MWSTGDPWEGGRGKRELSWHFLHRLADFRCGSGVVWCGVGRKGRDKDVDKEMVIWRKVLESDCLAINDPSGT